MEAYDQEGLSFSGEPAAIPAGHPLHRLFEALVERAFLSGIGRYDLQVYGYLADMLTDFSHMRRVYKIRDLAGRQLSEVADMLVEADVRLNALSFNREREVQQHIGDFTLFWTGLYPDSLPALKHRMSKDALVNYVQLGKTSYAIAATHDYGAYKDQAPVLARLSQEFEICMLGLNLVRQEMDRLPIC